MKKDIADLQIGNQISNEILFIVDYAKSLEQAIADGKYGWENSAHLNIKNFPISSEMIGKKIEVSAKIFSIDYDAKSDVVLTEMYEDNHQPATLMELLAFGIAYPELQRQFLLIALGASNCGHVPYLGTNGGKRSLGCFWFSGIWAANYRFLGIRK